MALVSCTKKRRVWTETACEVTFSFVTGAPIEIPIIDEDAPFNRGTWKLKYGGGGLVKIECYGADRKLHLSHASLGARGAPHLNLSAKDWTGIKGAPFAPSGMWSFAVQFNEVGYGKQGSAVFNVSCTGSEADLKPVIASLAPLDRQQLAVAEAAMEGPTTSDVLLWFPKAKREIWTSSALLRSASPYFGDLLDSGFKESAILDGAQLDLEDDYDCPSSDHDEEDSDSETDKLRPAKGKRAKVSLVGVRRITIKSNAHTTYRAVLGWIASRRIVFAPLSYPPTFPTQIAARTAALKEAASQVPRVPLPASPKSVFKLAHLLDIVELRDLALQEYGKQITIDNVLPQLMSDMYHYDQVRGPLVKHARDNWAAVSNTDYAKAFTKDTDEPWITFEMMKRCLLICQGLAGARQTF